MSLCRDPGVEVIGDRREFEAGVLGASGVVDQCDGIVLLARQRQAEAHHAVGGWSGRSRTRRATTGDVPPVPTATTTSPRSTIAVGA